jgi:hypothetical protein
VASAQTTQQTPWVSNPKIGEGLGVRAGDLELHWSLAGQAGYDSNYFLRSTMNGVANGPPTAPVIPALEFMVSPAFSIATVSPHSRDTAGAGTPPPLTFRAGVAATYRNFISLSSDSQASAPQNDIASNQNVSAVADARLDILPTRPWAGTVTATYIRAIQPNAIAANPDLSFNTDTVGGTGEIIFQPGSGTLDWHLGGGYSAAIFEQSQASAFTNGAATAFTRGRWNFGPKTALIYDGNLVFRNYTNSASAESQGLVSSAPIRTRIGLNGLVTNHFALLAMVGWGASFFDVPAQAPKLQQFDSVIGQAELKWFLTPTPGLSQASELSMALSSVSLGYTRDFQNSYLGNFYTSDRGYLRFQYFFGQRAVASLEGGLGAVEYPDIYWEVSPNPGAQWALRHSSFTDARADATLFAEYRVLESVGVNATVRYSENFSGTHDIPVAPMGGAGPNAAPNVYDMAWARFEAYLGVRWFM